MPNPRPTALAAYTRVSTQAQAESGLGLAAQRRTIEEAARVHGFEIATWHEDGGWSGVERNRPGLLRDMGAGGRGSSARRLAKSGFSPSSYARSRMGR